MVNYRDKTIKKAKFEVCCKILNGQTVSVHPDERAVLISDLGLHLKTSHTCIYISCLTTHEKCSINFNS